MVEEKIQPIDIILVTYQRCNFLKHTVKKIYERTLYPYRLWVIDNDSTDNTKDYLKQAKLNGYIYDYILLKENKGLAYGLTEGFKRVKSEYFITTQDDIVPPDLRPCWLERMLHLAKKYPDYGGIAMRIQRLRHRDVDEYKELIESPTSLPSVFRIQKKKDIEKLNGFGGRPHWESTDFVNRGKVLKKKFALTTHIYADHSGFMADNKGFAEGFKDYHTFAKERIYQGKDQPYPRIDYRTNVPLGVSTLRDEKEQIKRQRFWDYWGVSRGRVDKNKHSGDQERLAVYAAKGKGIDVGCGHLKCHSNAIGVDIFPFEAVDILADVRDLWMFKDEELDFVVASHVLEHMPDVKSVLREWKRVLKPGGVIGVVVPDGEKRPRSIKGSHKICLTKEQLRIIFKLGLRMRLLELGDVFKRDERKSSIIAVYQRRR